MKSTFAINVLVLASTAAAAPFTSRRIDAWKQRMSNAETDTSKTGLPLAVNYTSLDDRIIIDDCEDKANVQYSSNWAGAVQISNDITEVSGTVTFPTVSVPPGGDARTQYGGSAWIGIDGDTCSSSILQTGIDWVIQGNQTSYEAWYEWLPEYSYTFDIVVNPGDKISMNVIASSNTSGTATIENLTTGKNVSHTFSGETSLCEQNAEWIVEDFETVTDGTPALIPFAKFSNVTFTDATFLHGGTTGGVEGATIMDINQDGKVLTSSSTNGPNEVLCSYAGQ